MVILHISQNYSTIFKTMPSSINKSRQSLALFNKDWNIFKSNWSNATKTSIINQANGQIVSLNGGNFKAGISSLFTNKDINGLKEYNRLLQAGIAPSQAYKETMKGCTKVARQNAVAIAKGTMTFEQATSSMKTMTLSAKAGKVAFQALAAAGNILVIWGVMKVVSGLYSISKASETVAKKAKELGDSFKSTSSDINNYKSQIKELHKTINNSNSSIEDVTNARKTLMTVQDELIEKFGTEKSVIDDITEAINGQSDALDILTKKEWQKTKNDFNNIDDFGVNFRNGVEGVDNIERLLKEYGEQPDNKALSIVWKDFVDKDLTDGMIAKLEDIGINIRISEEDGFRDFNSLTESIRDIKNKDGIRISFNGNAEEVYNQLLDLQTLIKDDDSFDRLYDKIEPTTDYYKNLVSQYKQFYNQYILYEKILSDGSGYEGMFKDITSAYEEYSDAFSSGDEDKIKKATDKYASLLTSATSAAIENGDSDVATYFNNVMYPTLQSVVSEWKFNVAFDSDTDNLQNTIQKNLDKLKKNGRELTFEEISDLNPETKQYQNLVSIAHDYNLTLEEMIELLKERNLIPTKDYQNTLDFANKKFGTPLEDKNISFKDVKQTLEDEYQKIYDMGLDKYATAIKDGAVQSVFGNVDMDKRAVIAWSDEMKEVFADELSSWDYNPEIGSIDTVLGNSDRFGEDINGVGWEIAFTPVLPDGTLLSQETVYEYINTILRDDYANDKNAVKEQLELADAEGRSIGHVFVQGILAAVDESQNYENNGNWAETVGRLINFSGKYGSINIAKSAEAVDWDSWFKKNIKTDEDIEKFNRIAKEAKTTTEAIKEFTYAKKKESEPVYSSFEDVFNSEDFADSKEKLLDLAKSGEITAEVLQSTEDYKKLLTETGLSAEGAKGKILDLLSVQEKISGAAQGFDSLMSAYKEFKDEDIRFVTAQTLESLPDAFKNLEGFDVFSQIAGDPTSGTEQIQNAFNEIATQYLMSQHTLNGLINASEHDIQSYIANLKQMGVTNAEELVTNTLKALKQENELINAATKEYYEAYLKYLKSKDQADLDYVKSVADKNSQLAGALGKPYQTDYNNWCELLKKKAEAYNEFVAKLGGSLDKVAVAAAPYSEEGLNQAKAEAIVKNAKGKKVFSLEDLKNPSIKNTIDTMRNLGNVADYSKEQVQAAEKYLETAKIATEYKDILKLDLSLMNTDFSSTFSPDVSDSSSSKSDKDTKETFDWIEIKIQRLTELLDKLKTKADNTYTSWASRNTALAQAIDKTYEAINLQSQAYNRYMQEANSVGLSGYYKTLVQNGAVDISTISDETLKDQINEYQSWYEKAQDCLKTQEDLNAELNEFKTQKFNHLKSEYDAIRERTEAQKELIESQNGTVTAKNLPDGGACFEIRFYCH